MRPLPYTTAAERMRLYRKRALRAMGIQAMRNSKKRADLPNDFDNSGEVMKMARPYGGRLTCESCKSIDVRRWDREGRLRPGQYFSWSWTSGGEPSGNIGV